MTEKDIDCLLWQAYNLGKRIVFVAHNISVPGTEAEKECGLLREVARGKTTLFDTPAQMLSKFPDARPRIRHYLYRNANKLMEKDREIAERLVRHEYDMMGMTPPES